MPHHYCLYRHFDADGRLLYVGQSINMFARLARHGRDSSWFDKIATVTIQRLSSAAELDVAERKAIREEYPIYNKAQRRELSWAAVHQRAISGARHIVARAYAAGMKPADRI